MRILQIFNRYSHVGGEELVVAQITDELAQHHQLRNIIWDSAKWAVETGYFSRFRQFFAMAWNPQSIREFRDEVSDFQPDVILLHNTMPVGSAWLYRVMTRCEIPVIQYIHNFRPFSVNGYCWGDGKLLPQGLEKNFLPEICAASWQNSRIKTAWYAVLLKSLHLSGVYKDVDGWIAISKFMKETFIRAGIDEHAIEVISHSWQPKCTEENLADLAKIPIEEPTFLFLGRLTEEKGLRVLLDAWQLVEEASPNGRLIIAGDGPIKDEVERRCGELQRACYVGFRTGDEKTELLQSCAALVVPSIWWEPLGLVLYEAYDYGKPVIAARSGGIVDHVVNGKTGWLHEPGNRTMLAEHVLAAIADNDVCRSRGAAGRKLLLSRNQGVWINQFNEFVEKIIANPGRACPAPARPLHPTREEPAQPDVCQVTPVTVDRAGPTRPLPESKFKITAYLADQNPGHDRSFGISRMSQVVLDALAVSGEVEIDAITSKTSQQAPANVTLTSMLPWGTRNKWARFFTDHFHPLFRRHSDDLDICYFPKGYLPLLSLYCRPSVVTIHDTIIQYDEDHYPKWRHAWEYAYWSKMLRHTLLSADRIMTVSISSKSQIEAFMRRHAIPPKPITVTYEPCLYESVEQPLEPAKENYVIHLASREPHKRTAHLIRWWHQAEMKGRELPTLHLIGSIPPEVMPLLANSHSIVRRAFLSDAALQAVYLEASALILPSEIEGFGLPALEAYYLGTPVCYVKGTSVEEVLSVATEKGGFMLNDPESLFAAVTQVMSMSQQEIRECGLKLREIYAAEKVAERMLVVFRDVRNG